MPAGAEANGQVLGRFDTMIDMLQTKFGIPGSVAVLPGKNDLPRVTLSHRSVASAEIYLHGAHVT